MTTDEPDDDQEPLSFAENLYLQFVMPDELPAEALREAAANWPECREFFVALLSEFADGTFDPRDAGDALIFLIHLFAQMGEREAYRPLATLLRLPVEDLEDTLGDALNDALPRVLVQVFDGDPEPLETLILDPSVHEYARWPAIDAYAALAKLGRIDRTRAVRVLRAMDPLAIEPGDSSWIGWLSACAHLADPDLTKLAKQRLEVGAIATELYSPRDFEDALAAAAQPGALPEAAVPLGDAAEELSRWHGFTAAGVAERRKAAQHGGSIGPDTRVNPNRDIGRNDPCPCGSGKKFKKCHGA